MSREAQAMMTMRRCLGLLASVVAQNLIEHTGREIFLGEWVLISARKTDGIPKEHNKYAKLLRKGGK